MTIFDRYVALHFVRVFFICFFSFVGLFTVLDAFQNLDSFFEYGDRHGDLLATMASYYFYRSLAVFEASASVLTLAAAMFTTAWLQRYNEMTAMLAAGVAKRRILAPLLLCAVAASLGSAAVREFYLPSVRHAAGIGRNAQDLGGKATTPIAPLVDLETKVRIAGESANVAERKILRPRFTVPPCDGWKGGELTADEAIHQRARWGRPAGYRLQGAASLEWETNRPPPTEPLTAAGKPIVWTPAAADWLEDDELFVASRVVLSQLTGDWTFRKYASTSELAAALASPSLRFSEELAAAIHARLVQPLLDGVLVLLGLPLVLQTGRNRSIFTAIGQAILLIAAFLGTAIAGQELARQNYLSPAVGAWLPLFLFVPAAAVASEPIWEWEDDSSSDSEGAPPDDEDRFEDDPVDADAADGDA